jgi:hypothetical protein
MRQPSRQSQERRVSALAGRLNLSPAFIYLVTRGNIESVKAALSAELSRLRPKTGGQS